MGISRGVHASEILDLKEELTLPGVTVVVVDFYATWCKPCMEAVPKWKELHDRYAKKGLRFIVVSAEGEKKCTKPPDWTPDKSLCDDDESLMKQMGVKALPDSFAYSWDGALAISSTNVDSITAAVERYYREKQLTIIVDEPSVIGDKFAISSNWIEYRKQIIAEIKKQTKFDVVLLSSESIQRVPSTKCTKDIPPNAVLRITFTGNEKGSRTLTLELEKDGCVKASSQRSYTGSGLDEDPASIKKAITNAVADIVFQLVKVKQAVAVGATGSVKDNLEQYGDMDSIRKAEMERWNDIEKTLDDATIDNSKKFVMLKKYLSDFPNVNESHEKIARDLILLFARGKDPIKLKQIEAERNKMEWFAFRILGGDYGGGAMFSFFTLKWNWFYWEIVRLEGCVGLNGFGSTAERSGGSYGMAGTSIGLPIPLDYLGRHELRIGTGAFGGIIEYRQSNQTAGGYSVKSGASVLGEIYYVWHAAKYFSLQTGIELLVPVIEGPHGYPDPVLNGFIGFRI